MAKILGCGQSTASEMKRRRSIPVRYWESLIASDKGRELGLSSDVLMQVHSRHEERGMTHEASARSFMRPQRSSSRRTPPLPPATFPRPLQ